MSLFELRFGSDHDPIGFDMGKIIEHQMQHSNGSQVKHGCGLLQVAGPGQEPKDIFDLQGKKCSSKSLRESLFTRSRKVNEEVGLLFSITYWPIKTR